ncbi:hypothetical protein [uncultured Lacinutrix sp.]|uniref:hypothetical protein n=1 Tax=uncultured Lacinutrix sp. TaxID=574032 RepID=UPI00261D63BD|nr:hypothetical protein [uncultured Lacinutrix sp.]
MKNYKILSLLLLFFVATSCLVDDEVESDSYGDAKDLAGFTSSTRSLSGVTNGDEYNFNINLERVGPSLTSATSNVAMSVTVDPTSTTAIEGVHYTLGATSTTLEASNNYVGNLPITMLTTGIVAPLAENPVLKLNIVSVDGDSNVILNGSKSSIEITFVYQCFADLSGTYMVTNDFCAPSFTTTISSDGAGGWYIGSADGGFLHQCTGNTTLLNAGTIVELCGDILPSGDLDFGTGGSGNGIGDVLGGTWDAVNGVLVLNNQDVFFTGGPYLWTSTYTRL